ncbi:MAG: hypothetical protein AAFU41_13460 [Pseudomonadota bacterium]
MRSAVIPFAKLLTVLAVLIALTGTGFAHRAAGPDLDDSLQDYLAAGGSLADLCLDASGNPLGETCDACRLADTAATPCSADVRSTPISASFLVFLPSGGQPHSEALDPTHPARAPPVV